MMYSRKQFGIELKEKINQKESVYKIGWARFHKSCDISGIPKNITVTRKNDSWYISIKEFSKNYVDSLKPKMNSTRLEYE